MTINMKTKYNWLNHVFNFLAVILGVYLAFFINEKAQAKQEREESIVLMNSLLADFSDDIERFDTYQIPKNKEHQQKVERLFTSLLEGVPEDLDEQLSGIFEVENYSPATSTYSSMKATGKVSLIRELSLQKMLSDYYDGLVLESARKGEFQVDFFTEEILNWLTDKVDFVQVKELSREDIIVLRNKLFIYESIIDQKVKSYELLLKESRKLEETIKALLKKR